MCLQTSFLTHRDERLWSGGKSPQSGEKKSHCPPTGDTRSTSGQASLSPWRKQPGFWFSTWLKALGVSLTEECLTGSRTVYIQHVIRMSFPHYVWGLTAVGTIICFVQVIDEQIGPRQYGVLRHFIIDSHPSYHHRPVSKEEKDRLLYYFPPRRLHQTSHPHMKWITGWHN